MAPQVSLRTIDHNKFAHRTDAHITFDDADRESAQVGEVMGFRLRVQSARCMRAAAVSLFVVVAPAAFGQDSPTAGKTVFESNSVQACTACHFNVENRRQAIDPGGDLDFDLVYATFLNAIATVSVMNQFKIMNVPNGMEGPTACDLAQVRAAYRELKAHPKPVQFVAAAPPKVDEGEEPVADDTPVVTQKP